MSELIINEQSIKLGETVQTDIPVAKLYTDTDVSIPLHIIRAKKPGPTVFVSAAIHGDELNGIEIIRRLIRDPKLKLKQGTLILVPMVNVYGVLNQSRYMPDRRDLNRSFPGTKKGPLAGRVAEIFLREVVAKCDYGIDLHTGAIHRSNLPQIRADLDDKETRELAESFGVPVLLNSTLRDGSMRQAAVENGTKILLYEAGQALRLDELSIVMGLLGIVRVLNHLGLTRRRTKRNLITPFIAYNSSWSRANASGFVHYLKNLGDQVSKNDALAEIGGPFGELYDTVRANRDGIIIGKQNIPLVQEGDAMFHIAYFKSDDDEVAEHIELMQEELPADDNIVRHI